MGQKIHPLGFRVGITKKHQSIWFARFHKHQYAQSVLEDKFLRQNLFKLLPQLFQKKFGNSPNIPKISHIQIVRGLIPYEIGIQIHAQNCHLVKTAFEGLDTEQNFVHSLLKNHLILEKTTATKKLLVANKNNQVLKNTEMNFQNSELSLKNSIGTKKSEQNISIFQSTKFKKGVGEKHKKFAKFRQRFLGKVIIVKNGKKITRKFDLKKQISLRNNFISFFKKNIQEIKNVRKNRFNGKNAYMQKSYFDAKRGTFGSRGQNRTNISLKQKAFFNFFDSQTSDFKKSGKSCTKFVNLYMSQTNRSFLNALKVEFNYWNQYLKTSKSKQFENFGSVRYTPVGFQKKWSFRRFKQFDKLSFSVLFKLYKALQQKALKKMERLRKEYLVFGKFSKTKTFSYFQRIRFLQNLKKFISMKKMQRLTILNSVNNENSEFQQKIANQKLATKVAILTEKAIEKKFTNMYEEKNTMKFIDHLQNLVKQHRSKNIFLYLATISDARNHYRKIQNFTKQQADFLFGISANNLKNMQGLTKEEKQEIYKNKISKTFLRISQKNISQNKTFIDIFVEQLQKQRNICEQNMQFMPKISIQFYSVKSQNFQIKASTVAESIVDDLEKRKAFRRVIKKAKEDLMKTPKVKGVKIQVSGRLNGAEIARSEWVRAGRVPLQTLRADIDYCYKTAQTIYGIIGVKVWIYKGYTKTRKPTANSPSLLADLL